MNETTIMGVNSPENKPLDIQFQKRFSKNLTSNIVYFILSFVIGLFLTPFFLDSLGDAAYALVPLATSINGYITLIVSCLNGVVSRYLTLDLQRGDCSKANITYNTAIFGTLAVVLILLPVAAIIAWCIPYFFDTGGVDHFTVFVLFVFIALSTLIRTWTSNFQVTVFAYNRLDLWNRINSIYLIIEVIAVILLFKTLGASLISIGISYFIASIIAGCLALYYSKRITPYLHFNISKFDKDLYIEMGKMTGWFLVQQLGAMLLLPVCLILTNILYGAIAETQFSIAQTFLSLTISVSALVTNLFRPMVYAYIAKYDYRGVSSFLVSTIKITSFIMALPLVLLCLFSPQLLSLWVGEQYAMLSPLVCVLTLPAIIWIQSACIGPLNVACNKVKVTAIACLLCGCLNVALAYAFSYIFDWGVYSIAFSWFVVLLIHNGIFTPLYSAYFIHAKLLTLVKPMLIGILPVIVLFVLGSVILLLLPDISILGLVITGCILSVLYFIALIKIMLNPLDKNMIRSCLPDFVSNKIPKWML